MNYNEYFIIDYLLPLLGVIITCLARLFITISYKKYKQEFISSNKTGYDTAREILDKNGLNEVKIKKVSGSLTDHYDPRTKTVNLSADIYDSTSIAAVSVSSHECGHAIQDKTGYLFLKIRSSLVPIVNFSTKIGYLVVVLGLIFNAIGFAKIGIYLLLTILLFQLVTLPVEINASIRAEKELTRLKIINKQEKNDSKIMLISAASTYVASLATSLLQILRLVLIVSSRDRDN